MDIISAAQCRAARALLNWSQPDLATICGTHVQTISAFENETSTPTKTTLQKIASAFEAADIEFMPDSGLRKKNQQVRIYHGREQFNEFYKDVYDVAKRIGGEFCVSNVNEREFVRWFDSEQIAGHLEKMENVAKNNPKFRMRLLVEEGDTYMPANGYASYRWIKKEYFKEVPFYVYGDRMATLIFSKDDVYICVVRNQKVADAYRAQFNFSWEMAEKSKE